VSEAGATLTIRHDLARSRFTAYVDGGLAVLDYKLGNGTIDLHHTEVPPSAREHGVAGRLAEAALAYARGRGLRVIATCPFVHGYLKKHPEHVDLVAGTQP